MFSRRHSQDLSAVHLSPRLSRAMDLRYSDPPFSTPKPIYLPERQDLTSRCHDVHAIQNDDDARHMAILSGSHTTQKLQAMPKIFCPSCVEDEKPEHFKSKYGYKKHEENHHYYSGHEWHCHDCNLVFDRKSNTKIHFRRLHSAKNQELLMLWGHIELLPRDRFGCGFYNCRQWCKSWKERCDHVTSHMKYGDTSDLWSFSTVMLNLLRQDGVRDEWEKLRRKWGFIESALRWKAADCRVLRQKLECRDFRPGLSVLLEVALSLGIDETLPRTTGKSFQHILKVPSWNSLFEEVPNWNSLSEEVRIELIDTILKRPHMSDV